MKFIYLFARLLIYIPSIIIFPAKVINRKKFPKERRIIVVSNHLSWVDVLMLGIYFPGYRHFVGKKELGENWFVRFLAKILGVVLVDRSKPDMPAIKKVLGYLKKGQSINIFPEGTRNKVNESVQQVKSGVVMFSLKGDAPIVPVMIYKKSKPFRKNYLYVGDTFDLNEYKGRQLSSIMDEATDIVENKLVSTKEELDRYVENMRSKSTKRKKKEEKQ